MIPTNKRVFLTEPERLTQSGSLICERLTQQMLEWLHRLARRPSLDHLASQRHYASRQHIGR